MERAEAMRMILENLGVAKDIIQVSSHGEGNPLVPTEDEVSEPRNRRVEVLVR
jgi:outer membrane protein OmpA-like peptidoglycan-associated protein